MIVEHLPPGAAIAAEDQASDTQPPPAAATARRRRGLGAAVIALLVEDAGWRAAETVFLSAGDDAVARVYDRLGFRRVGVHRAAEPAQ